jgi:hypothetical protein
MGGSRRAHDESDSCAPAVALGLVRSTAEALVTVEILNVQGGGLTVEAPAVHTVAYAPGDRVLLLFQSDDLDSAVVVGRIGNPDDAAGGVAGVHVDTQHNVGIGTETPQGRLHTWDGTGGFLVASRTAIGTTAQVIIPDDTGDVTKTVRIEALVTNGTATTYSNFTLAQGGSMAQNVIAGSETFQIRLSSNGSLDIRRTVGTNAGAALVRAMWL